MKTSTAFLALSLVLSGSAIVCLPARAQLFGESDEEKAARQAHEDSQDAQITQLGNRVKELEDKVSSLTESLASATGANEELSHQIQELRQQIAAQQKDFAYRLCMLSAQQLGAGEQGLDCSLSPGTPAPGPAASAQGQTLSAGTPLPPIGDQAQAQPAPPPSEGGAPQQLAPPPGILGTLPSNAVPAPSSTASQNHSGQNEYDRAMNMLAQAQYGEASAAFRAYADANPDDRDLSPQAIYWIGDIAYVQHDYPTATRAFAEEIKKYPDSSRSPDSMLKLGQSLIAEGQTSGGCTTLAALKSRYPNAPAATLTAAAGSRKAACR